MTKAFNEEAIENAYVHCILAAQECAVVVGDGGDVNRPSDFAHALKAVIADGLPEHPQYACMLGVTMAVLFPRLPSRMGVDELLSMKLFSEQYVPRTVTGNTAMRIAKGLRETIMPVVRNRRPVLANGRFTFELPKHGDQFFAQTVCDLVLGYQAYVLGADAYVNLQACFPFMVRVLACDAGEKSRFFSRGMMLHFAMRHFYGDAAAGNPTRAMTNEVRTELAYHLYVNRVMPGFFQLGIVTEAEYCRRVALCTVREVGKPPVRIRATGEELPQGRQNLDKTVFDPWMG